MDQVMLTLATDEATDVRAVQGSAGHPAPMRRLPCLVPWKRPRFAFQPLPAAPRGNRGAFGRTCLGRGLWPLPPHVRQHAARRRLGWGPCAAGAGL